MPTPVSNPVPYSPFRRARLIVNVIEKTICRSDIKITYNNDEKINKIVKHIKNVL